MPQTPFTPLRYLATALGLMTISLLQGCVSAQGQPPLPLAKVDINRMYGDWYIIATIPNSFERSLVGPKDVFSQRPDGDIREDFYTRRGGFDRPLKHFVVHDWVRPGSGGAHWRVQVLWPINLPFLALYVDPDYRYALFGEDNRTMGWIYARQPTLPDADYQALLAQFAAKGYDSSRFRKFVQTPDQIGQPGVWSDGVKASGAAK